MDIGTNEGRGRRKGVDALEEGAVVGRARLDRVLQRAACLVGKVCLRSLALAVLAASGLVRYPPYARPKNCGRLRGINDQQPLCYGVDLLIQNQSHLFSDSSLRATAHSLDL
jgi:hypothetical protein